MNERQQDGEAIREAWRRGRPANMERSRQGPTSVLSIRIPDGLMMMLTENAQRRGITPSSFARELIERGLEEETPVTPTNLIGILRRAVEEAESARMRWAFEPTPTVVGSCWIETYAGEAETLHPQGIHKFIRGSSSLLLRELGETSPASDETLAR